MAKRFLAADRVQAVTDGVSDVEERSPDREKDAPENRGERQTLPFRQVPQTKSEARKDARALVLPELLEVGTGRWSWREPKMSDREQARLSRLLREGQPSSPLERAESPSVTAVSHTDSKRQRGGLGRAKCQPPKLLAGAF